VRKSPAAFRRELRLEGPESPRFAESLPDWQARDFAALDPAWSALAGRAPRGLGALHRIVRRAWIERPRGHAKTSDTAAQIAWILLAAREAVSGIAAAADRDQAALVADAVQRLARSHPHLCKDLCFTRNRIANVETGSRLEVVSSDVQSSFGMLPDFVVCDELCHWERPELWHSLLSSAAKRPQSVLVVLTNAGLGTGWQWIAREAARSDPAWYFSALAGPCAPWLSAEDLDEQRRLLPPSVFRRLWCNEWQHSDGGFVSLAEAEACRDAGLASRPRGQVDREYVAAVDYAEKHDRTVGVVCHREGDVVVVDRMDVVAPEPDRPVEIAWVEGWIERVARDFPRTVFLVDEYQLLGTIQRAAGRHDVRRFRFDAGRGNHDLTVLLRRLILNRHVRWFPGCGQLAGSAVRDDLETELASLVLRESASGRVRFDHRRDGRHHDDRAFALALACRQLHSDPAQTEWIDLQEGPFAAW
jgi:hypothetical protein